MSRRPPTLLRIVLRAAFIAAITFVSLTAGVGAFLAVRLDIGSYRFTSRGPYLWGTKPSGTAWYRADFVRTSEGLIFLGGPHGPTPPVGTLLGSAEFDTKTIFTGLPRQYRSEWTLSLTKVVPTADGPDATDTRAWIAIAAEGLSRTRSGARAVPEELRRGGATGVTFSVIDFAYNAGWRLLHDPVWPAGTFVLAAALAVAASWQAVAVLRRGPGACPACGYDRRGLPPGSVCPECGAVPSG